MIKKEARINFKGSLVIGLIILVLSLTFVFAAHTATTSSGGTSYNVLEDVTYLYNISINNTDSGASSNITQVNITLPSGFTFTLVNTNGTNRNGSFTYNSTLLSWTNSTYYLINGSTNNSYFWFNATAATPGSYNISILLLNGTGAYITQHNISITVNDTTKPVVLFVNPVSNGRYSGTQIINISATDNVATTYVWFNITNSSGIQRNSNATTNTSVIYWNFTLDTTKLLDGIYNISVYANDSVNNTNNSEMIRFTVDNTKPIVTINTPTGVSAYANNGISFNFTLNEAGYCEYSWNAGVTNKTMTNISSTEWTKVEALPDKSTHIVWAYCNDTAGNQNYTYNVSFDISDTRITPTTRSGGSSGGSSTITGTTTPTATDTDNTVTPTQPSDTQPTEGTTATPISESGTKKMLDSITNLVKKPLVLVIIGVIVVLAIVGIAQAGKKKK